MRNHNAVYETYKTASMYSNIDFFFLSIVQFTSFTIERIFTAPTLFTVPKLQYLIASDTKIPFGNFVAIKIN